VRVASDRVVAVLLAGSSNGEAWLRELLDSGASASAAGRALLLPQRRGSAPRASSPIVCNCFNVSEAQIDAALAATQDMPLTVLQSKLKCGTNCGSCLPELKRRIAQVAVGTLPLVPAA
jgi:assimilatory nitrate reductase catalytic subunit